MTKQYEMIVRLADQFFEWPTPDHETVSLTSALLFARHCTENADYLSQLHVLCADMGIPPGNISDRLFVAIERVRDLIEVEKAAINMCKVRGRHHSELAMNRLIEVCGMIEK